MAYNAAIGRIENWSEWVPIMAPTSKRGFRSRGNHRGYRNDALEEFWPDQCGIYELALGTNLAESATVYIGSTCRSKEGMILARIKEYCSNGSHIAECIDDALKYEYTIYARFRTSHPVRKEQAENDENNLLRLFDYPWNQRLNGGKIRMIHP